MLTGVNSFYLYSSQPVDKKLDRNTSCRWQQLIVPQQKSWKRLSESTCSRLGSFSGTLCRVASKHQWMVGSSVENEAGRGVVECTRQSGSGRRSESCEREMSPASSLNKSWCCLDSCALCTLSSFEEMVSPASLSAAGWPDELEPASMEPQQTEPTHRTAFPALFPQLSLNPCLVCLSLPYLPSFLVLFHPYFSDFLSLNLCFHVCTFALPSGWCPA